MVTSPYNGNGNGQVETAVKSAPHLGVNTNTPSQGIGSSPAQRLMNIRRRTLLPTTSTLLEPRSLSTNQEREKLKDVQKKKARCYNAHAKDLPPLHEGDTVRTISTRTKGMKEDCRC